MLLGHHEFQAQAVTDREFDGLVEASIVPVLVEFWKLGCGHCRALMAELERFQADMGWRLLILTMNVNENFKFPPNWKSHRFPHWHCIETANL